MWYGNAIYFLSDRDSNRRANLWAYDLTTKAVRQITKFTDYDVDWPSIGDNGIVFQQGGNLYVLDLPGEELHKLDVMVPDDGTRSAPRFVDASKQIRAYEIAPNGKLAFSDNEHQLWYVSLSGGAPVKVAHDDRDEIKDYSWSPDGDWLAYSLAGATGLHQIWLYHFKDGKATVVSSGNDDDRGPVFDRSGKYLFFVSKRHANPIFSQSEFNMATLKMRGIYVVTLNKDEASLFAPRSDEGSSESESRPSLTATPTPSATSSGAIPAIKIDLDGFIDRAVPVPVAAADYGTGTARDRKSTRLNSSHQIISYAVFCLKKKKTIL